MVDWKAKLENKSVKQMWEQISEKIIDEMNTIVPHRTYNSDKNNRYRKPMWMNKEALRQGCKQDIAYRDETETFLNHISRRSRDYIRARQDLDKTEMSGPVTRRDRGVQKLVSRLRLHPCNVGD